MNMKKLFLSLIILGSVSFAAFSQKQDGRRGDRSRVAKELSLTEDQQKKVKSLNEDFKTKMDALKADKSLSKDAKRDKMKDLSESKRNQFQALLTPEQKAKMGEMKDKRKDNPRKERKQRAERPRNKRENLNLTDVQKTQMRSLNESFRKQMQDLRADNSLDKDTRSAKRKELAAAHKVQVQSILTPEQQAKMKNNFDRGHRDFKKHGKFHGKKGRGEHRKFDAETKSKLNVLKENFDKEKKAIELSRIAPDTQKERIKELREKYRDERKEIVKKALQKSDS